MIRKLLGPVLAAAVMTLGSRETTTIIPTPVVKLPPKPDEGDSPNVVAGRTRLAAQQLVNEIASMQR